MEQKMLRGIAKGSLGAFAGLVIGSIGGVVLHEVSLNLISGIGLATVGTGVGFLAKFVDTYFEE